MDTFLGELTRFESDAWSLPRSVFAEFHDRGTSATESHEERLGTLVPYGHLANPHRAMRLRYLDVVRYGDRMWQISRIHKPTVRTNCG